MAALGEDARRMTRAQAQRQSVPVDENIAVAAADRVAAGKPAVRARRALRNIANDVKPVQGREAGKEKKPASTVDQQVAPPAAPAGPVTRRRSQELQAIEAEENTNVAANPAPAGRARAGLTSNLIEQSERASGLTGPFKSVRLRNDPENAGAIILSPLPNIDKEDMGDANKCAEYALDIFNYFKSVESPNRVNADYMSHQTSITRQMRAVLVDWLVEVHLKFKMLPETLFLTMWIIDRFLARQEVDRRSLQLVGIAGLLIASKYEEVYGPTMKDFEFICDGAYTRKQILNMERVMLKALNFHFTVPTAYTFVTRYVKASGYGHFAQVLHLAQYLCEWSLMSYTCLRFPYSLIAASAVHVSLVMFQVREGNGWPRNVRKHSGYSIDELQSCATYLVNLQSRAETAHFRALHNKFRKNCFSSVARYPAPVAQFPADRTPALPPVTDAPAEVAPAAAVAPVDAA